MASKYLDKNGLTYLWRKVLAKFKVIQTPVTTPSTTAGTATVFVDTISQDAQGVITYTTKALVDEKVKQDLATGDTYYPIISSPTANKTSGSETSTVLYHPALRVNPGKMSVAEGSGTTASNDSAHAEGVGSVASGVGAHAEGFGRATQPWAHAEGYNTRAEGNSSHAEGAGSVAQGEGTHAEGFGTIAHGRGNHAEGYYTYSDGQGSHAEGISLKSVAGRTANLYIRKLTDNERQGLYDNFGLWFNYLSKEQGSSDIPDGMHGCNLTYNGQTTLMTLTKYVWSPVDGDAFNVADDSVLSGLGTSFPGSTNASIAYPSTYGAAIGEFSHSEGYDTLAAGWFSHSEGEQSKAQGRASHAGGFHTIADNDSMTAVGKYNKDGITGAIFNIGIGTSDNARKNAHLVLNDGKHYIPNVGRYIGTETGLTGVKDLATVISDNENMESITWSALKAKRDGSTLIPGKQYRITDYQCTTVQTDTSAATHQFDVIVVADDVNVLNENARAIQHDGDTYFSGSTLEAWQLKYDIDNDTTKYAWADITNGKGVIWYMKDEFENECFYDFKNIMFKVGAKTVPGTVADVFYYTFSVATGTNDATVTDHSLNSLNSGYCYANKIGYCQNLNPIIRTLSSNIFRNTSNTNKCCGNIIEPDSKKNVFGNSCCYNIIKTSSYSNTFGPQAQSNVIGHGCQSNSFGIDNFSNNTIGDYCQNNVFGSFNTNNKFGCYCLSNKFGNYCQNNTFGESCSRIIFGNSSSTKSYYRYIIVESGNNFIYLDCTAATSSSSYYQNVKIVQGYNNTNNYPYKTITDSNVNQQYQTVYGAQEPPEFIPIQLMVKKVYDYREVLDEDSEIFQGMEDRDSQRLFLGVPSGTVMNEITISYVKNSTVKMRLKLQGDSHFITYAKKPSIHKIRNLFTEDYLPNDWPNTKDLIWLFIPEEEGVAFQENGYDYYHVKLHCMNRTGSSYNIDSIEVPYIPSLPKSSTNTGLFLPTGQVKLLTLMTNNKGGLCLYKNGKRISNICLLRFFDNSIGIKNSYGTWV